MKRRSTLVLRLTPSGSGRPSGHRGTDRIARGLLLDIAATKASTIQKRAAARDDIDLDLLLTRAGLQLHDVLKAGRVDYGNRFNPHITLKALSFFDDGDLPALSEDIKGRLQEAVTKLDLEKL